MVDVVDYDAAAGAEREAAVTGGLQVRLWGAGAPGFKLDGLEEGEVGVCGAELVVEGGAGGAEPLGGLEGGEGRGGGRKESGLGGRGGGAVEGVALDGVEAVWGAAAGVAEGGGAVDVGAGEEAGGGGERAGLGGGTWGVEGVADVSADVEFLVVDAHWNCLLVWLVVGGWGLKYIGLWRRKGM